MAKENKNKTQKKSSEGALPTIRKDIVIGHIGADKSETIDFEEPIVLQKSQFSVERYSQEFFKLIKARLKTPLIIVMDTLDSEAKIIQVGYFSALEAGLWYTIIPLTAEELAKV